MNFKKTQIKQTIEKILLVAQKNNGVIPISNINDASNLFAYLEGYTSWQAYVKENIQKKNEDLFLKVLDYSGLDKPKIDKYFQINLNSDIADVLLNQLQEVPKIPENKNVDECKDLDKKIKLGFKYNKITKANDIFFLKKENTTVLGKSKIKNVILKQMRENNTAFVWLDDNKDGSYLLNPIEEIFKTKLIDVILKDNQSIFEIMWLGILNNINKEMNKDFDIDFLLNSIDLRFIISYLFSNDQYNINKNLVRKYLNSININFSDLSVTEINDESIRLHDLSKLRIESLLRNIKLGYDQKIFGEKKEKIINYLNEKKAIKIFVPNVENESIYSIFNSVLNFNFKNYDNSTKNLKKENYGVWFFYENKNILVNNHFQNIFSLKFTTNIVDFKKIDDEQILFGKLDAFNLPEKDFLIYFYLNTKNMENNIFTEAGKELTLISEEEYYLWQKDNEYFNLNKIII